MPTTRAANFEAGTSFIERQSVAESARQLGLTEDAARQSLASSKERLFALRDSRPHPVRDEKILAAWNGLMISAFAQVGVALNEARYARAAATAARFVRNHLYDAKTGTLRRSWNEGTAQIPGFAEDYAFLIQALLDLYQADADSQKLDLAIALQRKQDELFWDAKSGGYFESPAEDQLVKVRLKQDYDGAEPSANSVSALNLLRLSRMLHEEHYANRAKDIFSTFSAALQNAPATAPQMLAALQFSRSKPRQAVIAGDPQQQATRLLVHSILRDFHPDLVLLYARDANALSGDAAEPSPPCDPSRESLLSTSAKTLPAARLSLRRRTRVGCSIAFRRRIWIKIFDPVTSGNGTADPFPLLCRWLALHRRLRFDARRPTW